MHSSPSPEAPLETVLVYPRTEVSLTGAIVFPLPNKPMPDVLDCPITLEPLETEFVRSRHKVSPDSVLVHSPQEP